MSKRFESGAQKRRKLKEIQNFKNKLPKLTNYFSVESTNEANSNSEVLQENLNKDVQCIDDDKIPRVPRAILSTLAAEPSPPSLL